MKHCSQCGDEILQRWDGTWIHDDTESAHCWVTKTGLVVDDWAEETAEPCTEPGCLSNQEFMDKYEVKENS